MTSNCDVTNCAHRMQMTTICRWMKPPPWQFFAYATAVSHGVLSGEKRSVSKKYSCANETQFLWLLPSHGAFSLWCRKGKAFGERLFAFHRLQPEKDKEMSTLTRLQKFLRTAISFMYPWVPSVSLLWHYITQNSGSTSSRTPCTSYQPWLWPNMTREGNKKVRCIWDIQNALTNPCFRKQGATLANLCYIIRRFLYP